MTIDQIMDTENISVTIKAKDLREFAEVLVAKTREQLRREVIDKETETLLTTTEVTEKLRVDRSTLYRWHSKGYLRYVEIGGQKRYRGSDVNELMRKR